MPLHASTFMGNLAPAPGFLLKVADSCDPLLGIVGYGLLRMREREFRFFSSFSAASSNAAVLSLVSAARCWCRRPRRGAKRLHEQRSGRGGNPMDRTVYREQRQSPQREIRIPLTFERDRDLGGFWVSSARKRE